MYKKVLMAAAAAALVALAAGCGPGPAPKALNPVSKADVAGAKLFVQYACVHCHGQRGQGGVTPANGGSPAPALNSNITAATVMTFLKNGPTTDHILGMNGTLAVNNGTLNMPYWYPFMTSKQRNELATYISDGLPVVPGVSSQPLSAKTGPQIFKSFACVKCHGPYNAGHNVNPGAIKGHGDHFIPTLGPKGTRFAAAIASWNAPFKTPTANKSYFRYNPTLTGPVTGQQFIQNKLLLGSIIHDGVAGGAPGAVFMPAWGQVMTKTQLNTIITYLKTGK